MGTIAITGERILGRRGLFGRNHPDRGWHCRGARRVRRASCRNQGHQCRKSRGAPGPGRCPCAPPRAGLFLQGNHRRRYQGRRAISEIHHGVRHAESQSGAGLPRGSRHAAGRIIRRDACVEVLPYASITGKRMGETLVDYGALAPDVAGFSDDGTGVQSEDVMRRAMRGITTTGKVLAAHCEVDSLLRGGYIHEGGLCTAAWSPWHLLRKRMAGSGTRHPACAGNRLPASYLPRLNPRERRAGAPGQGRRSPGNLRDREPIILHFATLTSRRKAASR